MMYLCISGYAVKDDPTDPDHVPSIFSYTPVTKKQETVLQKKVDRHQRLNERNHNKKRSVLLLGSIFWCLTMVAELIHMEVFGLEKDCTYRDL